MEIQYPHGNSENDVVVLLPVEWIPPTAIICHNQAYKLYSVLLKAEIQAYSIKKKTPSGFIGIRKQPSKAKIYLQ
jgi:hypothetical protein